MPFDVNAANRPPLLILEGHQIPRSRNPPNIVRHDSVRDMLAQLGHTVVCEPFHWHGCATVKGRAVRPFREPLDLLEPEVLESSEVF